MKRYQFTITLLSDVIISSATATEGFNQSLDYIPGSNFLGIVAGALYDEQSDSCLDMFHNGMVRYGDAYPLIENEAGFPVPFSWFHNKLDGSITNTPIYLDSLLRDSDREELTDKGIQLKQIRRGYFTPDKKVHQTIRQDFSIRSAYDQKELRASDSRMYGYFSLPEGSVWKFIVEDDSGQYGEIIARALTGKKRIGRSRSAEYGFVSISGGELLSGKSTLEIEADELTLLYAKSNLCFYDQFGNPTVVPSPAQLGLPEGSEVKWEKSQIRSRIYQTWNGKRHNRNADRMIIERGSVIAVSHPQPIASGTYDRGIGAHRSEGFGHIIPNPPFLKASSSVLDFQLRNPEDKEGNELTRSVILQSPSDQTLINFLNLKFSQEQEILSMDKSINRFIKNNSSLFSGISPSQWGTIRAYAKHIPDWKNLHRALFDIQSGALYRGQSEKIWRKGNRRVVLESFLKQIREEDRVICTLKLSAEIAKQVSSNQQVTNQSA